MLATMLDMLIKRAMTKCYELNRCLWSSSVDVLIFSRYCCVVRHFNGGPPEEVDYGCAVSHFFILL